MKTLDELKNFYQQNLYSDLEILEKQRIEVLNKCIAAFAVIAFLAGILIFLTLHLERTPLYVGLIALFVCVSLCAYFSKGYVTNFKEKVIARIIHFIDENLSYAKSSYISQREFEGSGIYTRKPEVYKGDDRVTGRIEKTDIDFSELHAQYITRDSKGRTQYHTIFKGLFFTADFNKHFQGHTIILPDVKAGFLSGIGEFFQKFGRGKMEIVKLEDPDFEREFAVYSTDQIEARYILSTSLMRRVVDFKKKYRRRIGMSFVHSKVYITIPYARNLFEPNIFTTLLDFRPIEVYFQDLQTAIGIVEDLNLNLRIWTKQ